MNHHTLRTRGATLGYARFGDPDDDPVILIQGLGMPGTVWHPMASKLAEQGFNVVVPDNRGTGSSLAARGLFSMPQLALDIAEIHAHAFEARPAIVGGISFGGMITQHVALRHPERVHGVVLAATTFGLPHNLLKGAFVTPQALKLLLRLCLMPHKTSPEDLRLLLLHEASIPRQSELFDRLHVVFTEQPTPPSTYLKQLVAALFHSTFSQLPLLTQPARVIAGDVDLLMPTLNAHLLAQRLPNATLTILERAGHAFTLEYPEEMMRQVIELRETLRAQASLPTP